MSTEKPTLVWVPGSFCPPEVHYAQIMSLFQSRGYAFVTVSLPTITRKPGPLPTMYDDAAHINSTVSKLADQGRDVVVVGHSYGGIPTTESLKGVVKKERLQAGKKGGVVRVGYVAGLVPEVGGAASSVMADAPMDYTAVGEDGWMYHPDPARTVCDRFVDVSPEEGIALASKFTQHSAVSFSNELTHAGYRYVPASWLLTEQDTIVPPRVQESGINTIERASGKKVNVTKLAADHMPHASVPEKVVDWLVSLVEKGDLE